MKKTALLLIFITFFLSSPLYSAFERLSNWLRGGPRYGYGYYYDDFGRRYYTYEPGYVYYRNSMVPRTRFYTTRGTPANKTSITEDSHRFVITVVLPGYNKEDIHVAAIDNSIQITASGTKIEQSILANPPVTSYEQTIPLPITIAPHEVQSDYRNGVLTITAPKATTLASQGVSVPVK